MKLETINPDECAVPSETELQQPRPRRDTRYIKGRFMSELTEHRFVRMGSAASAALLTGLLYQKVPQMEAMLGTPVSLDHLLAFGGSVAAFMIDDGATAHAAEGLALAGLVPLLRDAGRKAGRVSVG
jgi:hypothetical protein